MSTPRVETLRLQSLSRSAGQSRLYREWCFVRVLLRRFWLRFALIALILAGGAVSIMVLEEERNHNFIQGLWATWRLVLGESPDELPKSFLLDIIFFVMPVIGFLLIIESLIEVSLVLRDRRRFERSWCEMLASSYRDHIVLVGLGHLGFRTFTLLRRLGEAVVVIERNPQNEFLDEVRRDGSPLIVGDARQDALLGDANVAKAKSIVLATDDDMANLEVAIDSRRMNPAIRVVMRMFDQNVADKMAEGFDIHCAMSQSAISAPAFATSAIEPSIVNSFIVDDRLVVMQRWLVRESGPLAGRTVGDLIADPGVIVVEHRPARGEKRLFPPVETRLERGDRVIVQGPYEIMHEMQQQSMGATGEQV